MWCFCGAVAAVRVNLLRVTMIVFYCFGLVLAKEQEEEAQPHNRL